jgi:hypothetical protein
MAFSAASDCGEGVFKTVKNNRPDLPLKNAAIETEVLS